MLMNTKKMSVLSVPLGGKRGCGTGLEKSISGNGREFTPCSRSIFFQTNLNRIIMKSLLKQSTVCLYGQ